MLLASDDTDNVINVSLAERFSGEIQVAEHLNELFLPSLNYNERHSFRSLLIDTHTSDQWQGVYLFEKNKILARIGKTSHALRWTSAYRLVAFTTVELIFFRASFVVTRNQEVRTRVRLHFGWGLARRFCSLAPRS